MEHLSSKNFQSGQRLYFHSFNCGAQLRQLEANIWPRLWRELIAKTEDATAVITMLDGVKIIEMGLPELQGDYGAGKMIEAILFASYLTLWPVQGYRSVPINFLIFAHPMVPKKVYEGLDRVIGTPRLPTLGTREFSPTSGLS